MVLRPRPLQARRNMVHLQPPRNNGQRVPPSSGLYQSLWRRRDAWLALAVHHRWDIYHPCGVDRVCDIPGNPRLAAALFSFEARYRDCTRENQEGEYSKTGEVGS